MPRRRRNDPPEEAPADATPPPEVVPQEQARPVLRSTASIDPELDRSIPGADRVVRDVMVRQLEEDSERVQQTFEANRNDSVLGILDAVVAGIKNGTEISSKQEAIAKIILNQEERASLIDQILLTHDYERLANYVKARKVIEDFLLLCAQRGDLSATEALAFMKIIQTETAGLSARIRSGATKVNDIVQLVEKVDYKLHQHGEDLGKKFSKTSPQSREIIRRLAHKLNKASVGPAKDSIND